MSNFSLIMGDCLSHLQTMPINSADAVITDPIYPNVQRDYGVVKVDDWDGLMDPLVGECRRILKPGGSALFILQAGQKPGPVKGHDPWLFAFMSRWATRWGMPQDLYWWNYTMLPCGPTNRGGCRPSVKNLVWLGDADCYRSQEEILWTESMENAGQRAGARACGKKSTPSGHSRDRQKMAAVAEKRGGVTPFNLFPVAGCRSTTGHGAETPLELADLLVRYLCPPGGTVLDPFAGSCNIGVAALRSGRNYIGIDRDPNKYKLGLEHLGKVEGGWLE